MQKFRPILILKGCVDQRSVESYFFNMNLPKIEDTSFNNPLLSYALDREFKIVQKYCATL